VASNARTFGLVATRAGLDLRLSVRADEAFARLSAEAGLALQLAGRPASFEIVATPLPSPLYDDELVRCVLRGRFQDVGRGSWARARLLVRPYWRGVGRRALGTSSWGGLNLLPDLTAAGEGEARLRRQQRAMLKMWAAALVPVAGADVDDPFRGLAASG
jgi:hypothetical protein